MKLIYLYSILIYSCLFSQAFSGKSVNFSSDFDSEFGLGFGYIVSIPSNHDYVFKEYNINILNDFSKTNKSFSISSEYLYTFIIFTGGLNLKYSKFNDNISLNYPIGFYLGYGRLMWYYNIFNTKKDHIDSKSFKFSLLVPF